jgi:protein-L-isoaspartate(D-aspartate) O-methyltransferase
MDFETARLQMVDQQVRTWDVLDPQVLDVMGRIPRERFVPAAYRDLAFADAPIPLQDGQQMLPPKLDARILQACEIQPGESVIDVGTGSGFLAACLSTLGANVQSIEIRSELVAAAKVNLQATGYAGVALECADATTWTPNAPVDVIILTASLPVYDARYEHWLKLGGRLFVVTGARAPMSAQLITRTGANGYARRELFETSILPLTHAPRSSGFVF